LPCRGDLRDLAGRTRITTSVGTTDYEEAKRLRWAVVRAIHSLIFDLYEARELAKDPEAVANLARLNEAHTAAILKAEAAEGTDDEARLWEEAEETGRAVESARKSS
jgi:hypothetical protein